MIIAFNWYIYLAVITTIVVLTKQKSPLLDLQLKELLFKSTAGCLLRDLYFDKEEEKLHNIQILYVL